MTGPRRFAAVSTVHAPGYEAFGRRMIESFERFWPGDIPLIFYTEGFTPASASERILFRELLTDSPDLVAFKARHANSPVAHGSGRRLRWKFRIDWRKRKFKIRLSRNIGYRWDAVRFSHKMFAIFDAVERCEADVLIWSDADMRFVRPIPRSLLEWLVPADSMLGFLARRAMYSECGFVAYNLRHPAISDFLAAFRELYVTDALFREREWHDSYLFDVVRKRFERRGCTTFDIAEGAGDDTGHVITHSRLAAYMEHDKGERKAADS